MIACLVFLALVTGLSSLHAQTVTESHRKAAEKLLATMRLEQTYATTVSTMIDLQIQSNPALADYADVLKEWATKHIGWSSLRDDMATLYAKEFSEKELNELAKFYNTPIGQKVLEKQPLLMKQGGDIGRRKAEEHTEELKEMIQKKMNENKEQGKN